MRISDWSSDVCSSDLVALVLHNTLTRVKEVFEPIDPQRVRMYVCGPTVYDFAHIGNARPVVVFDVLYRLLKRRYPAVLYARNITDVRSEDRRVGKECVSTFKTRGWPVP